MPRLHMQEQQARSTTENEGGLDRFTPQTEDSGTVVIVAQQVKNELTL
jgi:hypothetical protein